MMRALCPHCHAEESRCPEVLPACSARGAAHRLLYARANGSEVEALRAENEALRAELARRASRVPPTPLPPPAPPRLHEFPGGA